MACLPEWVIRELLYLSASWRETELARGEDVSQDLATVLIRGTKCSTRYRTVFFEVA